MSLSFELVSIRDFQGGELKAHLQSLKDQGLLITNIAVPADLICLSCGGTQAVCYEPKEHLQSGAHKCYNCRSFLSVKRG